MKRNKLLAFMLSLCLTVGLIPTLTANAEVMKDSKVEVEYKVDKNQNNDNGATATIDLSKIDSTPIPEDALKESKGIKKKAVVWALKHGGSALKDAKKYLGDSRLVGLLGDNACEIGCYLETITQGFEGKLINFMIFELHFSQADARIITDAIMQVLF